TAGLKVALLDEHDNQIGIVKARELANQPDLLFRRNSQTGAIECKTNKSAIAPNGMLPAHNRPRQPSPAPGAPVRRPARSAQQALHRSGCSPHAEGGRDHGHRTEAAGTVQFDPFPYKALLLAYRAIRLGVAQLLQGIDAGHAEAALALGAGE